ncbi:MAG: hypothetical protein QM606_00825 [Leucobacter sp.]
MTAIRIASPLATRGIHALMHRAIDAELGLSTGSTSYCARFRRDLVKLIADRLAARTGADMGSFETPDRLTPAQAAALVTRALDASPLRADEHLARIALHIEYRGDPEMLAARTGDPPVRPGDDVAYGAREEAWHCYHPRPAPPGASADLR